MELKDQSDRVIATATFAKVNDLEGIWLEIKGKDGSKPTLCLIDEPGRFYLGVYKDATKPTNGCDFALSFTDKGPMIQVTRNEEVKFINLFDLATHLEKDKNRV